jgi:hypothetical protein
MINSKSLALLAALPLMVAVSGCASHKYVDDKITVVNGRLDQNDAHLSQLDKTTQPASWPRASSTIPST